MKIIKTNKEHFEERKIWFEAFCLLELLLVMIWVAVVLDRI